MFPRYSRRIGLMELATLTYQDSKWSQAFPSLDSRQTLVIVFGAPEFIDQPAALEELAAAYPTSTIIGCSTSGEIYGESIQDTSLSVGVVKFEHTRLDYGEARIHRDG